MIAADALRVEGNVVRVPGGEAAEPAWRALVGKEPRERRGLHSRGADARRRPARLLLWRDGTAHARPAAVRAAPRRQGSCGSASMRSGVSSTCSDASAGSGRLPNGCSGGPRSTRRCLPPTSRRTRTDRRACQARARSGLPRSTLVSRRRPTPASAAKALAGGEPADFPWLCDQIFKGGAVAQRQPYEMVLFASRVIKRITAENVQDALDSVHAVATLSRARHGARAGARHRPRRVRHRRAPRRPARRDR